jgi:glycosyltransferase 2 family protein
LSSKLINGLKYLLFLLLGIFLLWLSFRQLDLSEVWADILKAHYIWMFIALVFAVFLHIFRALRWNLLINSMGYQTKLTTTFYAVMVGYMANTAVPRMGEFMRCGMLARKGNIPFNALIGSVISERVFDLLVLLVLLFGVVVFQWDLAGGFVTRMIGPLIESVISVDFLH